jgi:4-diphosphocytidyl-2-C-methyl-D-erythritol kinase
VIVFPNAKINIGLNVVEKRSDGFHNIESVFYPIFDVVDVLEIVESDELSFSSSGISIPGASSSNLCLKAFQLLKNEFDIPPVKIHLHKMIPIGAGLGGGSADAAFTLKVLNELFQLELSNEKLCAYSRMLGSDCAFFINNKPVYAAHKGDEFEAISLDLSAYKIVIKYPNIHIGTAEAYGGIVPKLANKNIKDLIETAVVNWKETVVNDFEAAVFPHHPAIKKMKEQMYLNGAVFAAMTGSGSAVFGLFEKK